MAKTGLIAFVIALECFAPNYGAAAQRQVVSGLYQIVSGTYSACCGIGGDFPSTLPNESQSFVNLMLNPQDSLATMTFLADDLQTVFSIVPCPAGDPIRFNFPYGFVRSNVILFHVDPGPPPYSLSWSFAVTNAANRLFIDGLAGVARQPCVDVPTQFRYSNVVAVLVPAPKLRITEFSKDGALLFVQGEAGRTNVIQASEDLVTWTSITTNLMPATVCPVCPYIVFQDTASTNLARRFYRCLEMVRPP